VSLPTELDTEILTIIREGQIGPEDALFHEMARKVFRQQFNHIPFYQRYCKNLGQTPDNISTHLDIPPVPTTVFRRDDTSSFSRNQTDTSFLTSGTSSEIRGTHRFDSLKLYEEACAVSFAHHIAKKTFKHYVLSLIPSVLDAPHSSLSHMVRTLSERFFSAPPQLTHALQAS